jgi:signal transduction histidine kinase
VFVSALLVPPYLFGRLVRTLAERNQRLGEQAQLLLAHQATVRQEAVTAERARIARELHDVIAHSVSAMVVQAEAARDLVHRDPDRAAAALDQVTNAGRGALAETGRLLHLIRDTDEELGLEPNLGLDRLPDLVDGFRRSGLQVDLVVDGRLDGLPAGVDVSGYRIVQEALTNALKYAVDRLASVRLVRRPDVLQITAENAGARGATAQPGSGLGLVGMAERVSVFGGTLSHGFTDDGRFRLAATLPIVGTES